MKKERLGIIEFNKLIQTNRIICFGVSKHLSKFMGIIDNKNFLDAIDYFVDNEKSIQGTRVCISEKDYQVKSPDALLYEKNVILLIMSGLLNPIAEIVVQLNGMEIDDSVICCSALLIEREQLYDNSVFDKKNDMNSPKIDKKIHSFWFSKEEKPRKYKECIDSWSRFCPDYKIIEWNAENYDITKNKYMFDAFKCKKWAFVSDYARLDVLYNFGGIYLDMDVEVLKNLDELLKYDAFFSFDYLRLIDLGSGFGSVKGNHFIEELLNTYKNIEFKWDISEGKEIIPQPLLLLPLFKKFGYKMNNRSQIIDDVAFLSPDYFRVIEDVKHDKNKLYGTEYAIHWHTAGWFDKHMHEKREKQLEDWDRIKNLFNKGV